MASTKTKGDFAELRVAADLVDRGYKVAIPFGEDCDFDLLLIRGEQIERVQVKYTESDGSVIAVRCRSASLTNGKVRATKKYTAEMVDWIAVFDVTTNRCYYLHSSHFSRGRAVLHLRLEPAKNNQRRGIRYADDFLSPDGLAHSLDLEAALQSKQRGHSSVG